MLNERIHNFMNDNKISDEKAWSIPTQSISTNYDNFVAEDVKNIKNLGLMSQGHRFGFLVKMTDCATSLKSISLFP